jgi:hypothetical protein
MKFARGLLRTNRKREKRRMKKTEKGNKKKRKMLTNQTPMASEKCPSLFQLVEAAPRAKNSRWFLTTTAFAPPPIQAPFSAQRKSSQSQKRLQTLPFSSLSSSLDIHISKRK